MKTKFFPVLAILAGLGLFAGFLTAGDNIHPALASIMLPLAIAFFCSGLVTFFGLGPDPEPEAADLGANPSPSSRRKN